MPVLFHSLVEWYTITAQNVLRNVTSKTQIAVKKAFLHCQKCPGFNLLSVSFLCSHSWWRCFGACLHCHLLNNAITRSVSRSCHARRPTTSLWRWWRTVWTTTRFCTSWFWSNTTKVGLSHVVTGTDWATLSPGLTEPRCHRDWLSHVVTGTDWATLSPGLTEPRCHRDWLSHVVTGTDWATLSPGLTRFTFYHCDSIVIVILLLQYYFNTLRTMLLYFRMFLSNVQSVTVAHLLLCVLIWSLLETLQIFGPFYQWK